MENNNVAQETTGAPQAGEMNRVLTTKDLVVQGLAWLCPACIVMYYGVMNQVSGGAFPMTVLIAGIVMLFAGLGYANISTKYTQGGSVYTYVGGTFGPRLGFMTGWLLLMDYFLVPMMCYLTSGLYLNILFPSISANVFTVLTILFTFVCNFIGVKFATIVNFVNIVVPIAMLVLTIVFILKFVLTDAPQSAGTLLSLKAFASPDTIMWGGVFQGAAICCELFIGFDIATTLAGEAKNPTKTVPKAVIIIIIYTIISFTLVAYLLNCGWVYEEGMLADPNTGITEYYAYLGLAWMNIIFVPINTIACIGCSIAGNISSSRIMYNMARDGFLPKKFFGYIHPKFKTPSFNLVLAAILGLGSLLCQGQVLTAANFCSFGGLLAMAATNACVIVAFWVRDRKRSGTAILKYLIFPIIAIVCTMFLWTNLEAYAKIFGFSWLALGVIVLGIRTKGFREMPPEMDFSSVE
ncbi:MAG: APC family permease [Firmicutes bacterium]|nr:APC family permease [Bacillota bacterium]